MTCATLVTAGGSGNRMGADVPKQYLDLEGIPILIRTLSVFENHPLVDAIVLTVPPGDEDFCRSRLLAQARLTKIREIVAGGQTRQQSVHNGLERLEGTEIVAIHDGVRPLVTAEVITKTIEAARDTGAALACVPVRDTVKRRSGSHLQTINRSDLWLAHTPQTFRTPLILHAHRTAEREGYIGTDDASLVERLGHTVAIVRDTPDNIKITTPEDLHLARLLIRERAGL